MKENRQILSFWNRGTASVLVTLVRTKGSSYRQPGARLLLGSGNAYVGTISGGCLEAEVIRKAAWLVRDGAIVEQYSTMFDDTADIPFGLGCGGVVDLLLEPAGTPECRALIDAMEQALSGREAIVVSWLPGGQAKLARAVLSPAGDLLFASPSLSDAVLARVRASVLYGPGTLPGEVFPGEVFPGEIFVERLVAPQRLFILGAGDDAKPLVSLAALLGWNVRVLDARPNLARPERFPEAESVSVVRSPTVDLRHITRGDAVVLMTHSYEQDRDMLAAVLPLRPGYLGMLGARHRTSLLVSEVAAKLEYSLGECCDRIQAPVGLDLGGDGAEVIALAVIAEIQASRTGKLPNSRKLSPRDIEDHMEQGGSMQYRSARCALDAQ